MTTTAVSLAAEYRQATQTADAAQAALTADRLAKAVAAGTSLLDVKSDPGLLRAAIATAAAKSEVSRRLFIQDRAAWVAELARHPRRQN